MLAVLAVPDFLTELGSVQLVAMFCWLAVALYGAFGSWGGDGE